MPEETNDIFIANRIGEVPFDSKENYLAHMLCIEGSCNYTYNDKKFELKKGDVSIIRKRNLIYEIEHGPDFRCKIIYASPKFISLCTPQTNYGIRGSLALFLNPVMSLSPEEFMLCLRDYEILESRIADKGHLFWQESVINAMQATILDFFNFHARLYDEIEITSQQASIMARFLDLLDNGSYREHREVSYYADKLCVTSKYLSEVAKKVSGSGANYWINRYTILDISRLLRDKSLTFVQISDMFGFSSPAYFSRYVQQYLGIRPSDYRE